MNFKKTYPIIFSLVLFIFLGYLFFSPVLEGKKIFQSDIVQHKGMSKEIQDFRTENRVEPYWTNAAFGGMPAFQVSSYFPNDYIKKIDHLIRFLPHPINFLFLYLLSFFVMLIIFKVDWKLAILGAIAFGFSTYLIIILGVGHNAKAHAIGYFPLVIGGVWLVFQNKKMWGFFLTTIATALEINAGHVQMTYYLFFLLVFMGISEFYNALQDKNYVPYFKKTGILLLSATLAVAMNANHLLPTKEYAAESTRSKSELTIHPDGSPKEITGGLDKDYITEYSYGVLETFNLFIPGFTGGGNAENFGKKSNIYKFLKEKIGISEAKDFSEHAPGYWGNQPIVAAPAYIGSIVIFLFILGVFLVEKRYKRWLIAGIVISLFLSWGKNFSILTDFFIDYIPMYDKFRAVSSIQVLLEFAIPLLGVLGLQQFFFNTEIDVSTKEKALKYTGFGMLSLTFIILIFGKFAFSFSSVMDETYEQMIPDFTEAIVADRKALLFKDSLRSFILVLVSFGVLWAFLKKYLKTLPVIVLLSIFVLFDGFQVAKRYVNKDDFVRSSKVENPFEKNAVNETILEDKGVYRVANFTVNPLNDASTSYFHHSIGGYHAAKPRRYQELFEYQVAKNNFQVLNMLNAKYLIVNDENNNPTVQLNNATYGNAWFSNHLIWVKNANEEIMAMDSIAQNKAVLEIKYKNKIPKTVEEPDTSAVINLISYKPNKLTYKSKTSKEQLALFSENYYPHGWKASIDGQNIEILRANYVLRALVVPAGDHEITFVFEPEIVKKGATISLVSFIIFISLFLFSIIWTMKNRNKINQ